VEVVVDAADRIHLSNDTIVYLSELLNGDPKRFMEKQIAGAVKENDVSVPVSSNGVVLTSVFNMLDLDTLSPAFFFMVQVPRASRVQIELHDYEMDNKKNKGKFDMLKFSQLKTPMDWGNGNAKKAQSMMQVRESIVV
jgi:hypothetical protein